jgi:S-adenosylmethionine decarboxylase
MVSGLHLIVDVLNITNTKPLETIEGVEPLMKKIIEAGKLTVVGQVHKQFEPIGATMLYLLSESHLSIHTYPEKNYCAIDVYCCNLNLNVPEIVSVINDYFNGDCVIMKKLIER